MLRVKLEAISDEKERYEICEVLRKLPSQKTLY